MMNIKIEKVDINNNDVLDFLALENLKLFLDLNPNIKALFESEVKELLMQTFTDEFKKEQKEKAAIVYKATIDGKLVGAVQLNHDHYLSSLFVKEEYRNQQIGTKLLERLIENCKDFDVIKVDARIEAVSLYKKFSFHETGIKEENISVSMELERSHYGK